MALDQKYKLDDLLDAAFWPAFEELLAQANYTPTRLTTRLAIPREHYAIAGAKSDSEIVMLVLNAYRKESVITQEALKTRCDNLDVVCTEISSMFAADDARSHKLEDLQAALEKARRPQTPVRTEAHPQFTETERSEPTSDLASPSQEQLNWLWEIKDPKDIDPAFAELGYDYRYQPKARTGEQVALPARKHYLWNDDPYTYQSPEAIQTTINRHSRIVVVSRPQYSGKSMLAEYLVQRIDNGSTTVCYDLITLHDIRRAISLLDNPQTASADSVKFILYSIWAQAIVEKYCDKNLTPEKRRQLATDPRYDQLHRYRKKLEVVAKDIQDRRKCYAAMGPAADFLALEESVLHVLAGLVNDPNVVLAIEAEDIHEYTTARDDDAGYGKAIVDDFWKTVQGLCEQPSGNMNPGGLGRLRFIITTRPRSPYPQGNGEGLPLVEIEPFREEDCRCYASALGLGQIFSKEELEWLVREAHQWTNGYAGFLTRFLRAVVFLRANRPDQSLKSLVHAVSSCSLFWYFDDPCGKTFQKAAAEFQKGSRNAPNSPNDHSRFLQNVLKAFRSDDLIDHYAHALSPVHSFSSSAQQTYLLTLVQLGLIRSVNEAGNSFRYINKIVEQHFSPKSIQAMLTSDFTETRHNKREEHR